MGNNTSKTIEVDNLQYHLSKCQQLGSKNCPVYGNLHLVMYNNLQVYLGQSHSTTPPSNISLHYLLSPNLLIIPQFTLLQNTKPSSLDSLIDLMTAVAQVAIDNPIGFSHNRIGFAGRWGIVGQKKVGQTYSEIFQNPNQTGIYLSPQLMSELSRQNIYPEHDPVKSDMFAFGVMVLEIIFQEKLSYIFDYHQYEIKLKPLLEKLSIVREEFGEGFYGVVLRMLELDENERIDFGELLGLLGSFGKKGNMLTSYMNTSSNSGGAVNNSNNFEFRSPLNKKSSVVYKNNCSPFKGGNAFLTSRTPEKSNRTPTKQGGAKLGQREGKSPLKRDLRINTQFGKQNNYQNGFMSSRSPNKPTLLRRQGVSPLSKR